MTEILSSLSGTDLSTLWPMVLVAAVAGFGIGVLAHRARYAAPPAEPPVGTCGARGHVYRSDAAGWVCTECGDTVRDASLAPSAAEHHG